MNCCKTADDVWFMLIRVLNGVDCYLDEKVYMDKDNTKSERALFLKYNQNLNNTIQIKNTIMKIGGSRWPPPMNTLGAANGCPITLFTSRG